MSALRQAFYVAMAALLTSAPAAGTAVGYFVTVNTTAISGTNGFIDFSFAPGSDSQSAFVTISGFSTDGTLNPSPQLSGGATGALPGIVTIDNSTQFNDYFQSFDFQSDIAFTVLFDGPAVTAPNGTSTSGSTFTFSMFDSSGTNPLLTDDPNGSAFTVDLNLDGSLTPQTFSPPVVQDQSTIPEPPPFLLVGSASAVWLALRRRATRARPSC